MKISNSKKQLAKIISENGGWRDGASWSAQDSKKDDFPSRVCFYANKPTVFGTQWRDGENGMFGEADGCIEECNAISNWHQTILSRDEYFYLYPAPDADGWIEWKGGECPVDVGTIVDVKHRDGDIGIRCHAGMSSSEPDGEGPATAEDWSHLDEVGDIIAYRLHKPEQAKPEFCESVMRSIPEPEAKPTIEQLAADYRNLLDFAKRKQEEADDAKADADARLKALELAGEALGLLVSPINEKQEPELVITDWRDLQVGDEVEGRHYDRMVIGAVCEIDEECRDDRPFRIHEEGGSPWWVTSKEFRFIRRP